MSKLFQSTETSDEGGSPDLPEELQGKSPTEVFAALNTQVDAEANKRASAIVQHQEEEKSKAAPQEEKKEETAVDPLASLRNLYGSTGAPTQTEAPPTAETAEDEQPSIYTDPDKYLDQKLQQRMGPVVQENYQNQRATNSMLFRAANKTDYEKYGNEIEAVINTLSPQIQAQLPMYDMAMRIVKGSHVDEIVQEAKGDVDSKAKELAIQTLEAMGLDATRLKGDTPTPTNETAQTGFSSITGTRPPNEATPGGGAPRSGPVRAVLTEQERRVAASFGMSEEDYSSMREENTDIISQMKRGA